MKWKPVLEIISAFVILALLGCSATPTGTQGTQPLPTLPSVTQPALELTPTNVLEPTSILLTSSTPELAPTDAPQPADVLPGPLYFLGAADQQIWRIEPDGKTVTQITHESAPVIAFDVSPIDSRLVYVSHNDMVVSDVQGGDPNPLVIGGPFDPNDSEGAYTKALSNPHWLSDGAQIAYTLNGINLIDAGGGQPQVIAQNAPISNGGGGQLFLDGLWSPDGQQVLLSWGVYRTDAFGFTLKSLLAGTTTDVTSSSIICCNPAWTPDSQSFYLSNDAIGFLSAGLWRVNAQTGVAETLFDSSQNSATTTAAPGFSHAQQLSDGRLYYFYTEEAADFTTGVTPEGPILSMTRSEPDGATNRTQLRSDAYKIAKVLWAPDGQGAVITQPSNDASGAGSVLWLDAADHPAVPLPADGSQLHWGILNK